jgi:23S rRNA (adenine1618-N6)-methyltransferase
MPENPEQTPTEKENLHPRNLHRGQYDFATLIKSNPQLAAFVKLNQYHNESITFSDPDAVKALNKALLKQFYAIKNWDIPPGYLCPPIPGRADYIHYMADLLASCNKGVIPTGPQVKILDIGTGANMVYPLIGNKVYGWEFVGTDIDPVAMESANKIISTNPQLKNDIVLRLQTNSSDIFKRVIRHDEVFDLTICNPPFHSSFKEAQAGTIKKWNNLNKSQPQKEMLNFGGKNNELWCAGGEAAFIRRMIEQSTLFAKNVFWFSTLVSKKENLVTIYKQLRKAGVADVKTISMSQGQKTSRVVAWTFLNETEQVNWRKNSWL